MGYDAVESKTSIFKQKYEKYVSKALTDHLFLNLSETLVKIHIINFLSANIWKLRKETL